MKKSTLLKVFTLLIFLGHGLIAQEAKISFKEFDLENGLHVILHQDNTTPIVSVSTMYHVGSKNEEPDKTGFAHFFEHVASRRTKNIPVGGFTDYVSQAGGTRNASTNFDRTYYFEIFPSNYLEMGLWMESERMLNMVVDSTVVETQREVVKEEKRLRYDNQPYGTLLPEMLDRAYKVHPYRWPVIGSMEHLDNASIQDFINFRDKFYVPNNAVLSIAGDIDMNQTESLVKLYFSDIPAGDPNEWVNVDEPPQKNEIRDLIYDNVQLPAVIFAYHMPAAGTEDFYALSMLTTLLADGASSRMNKALVDNKQLAVASAAIPLPLEDPGLFIAFGIANLGVDVGDLEEAMQEEIDKVKENLIEEREFQKIRNQVENDFISSNSMVAGIAESLAEYYLIYGNTNLINTELDKFLAVTREDIQRVARKYLVNDNRVVLHWLPNSSQ
ncbi:MAG: insulinase family protein [Cyclobacteriaceae bacterium]|nr:insulinase family protein [Cyclobacteriaceae bacterium]